MKIASVLTDVVWRFDNANSQILVTFLV